MSDETATARNRHGRIAVVPPIVPEEMAEA